MNSRQVIRILAFIAVVLISGKIVCSQNNDILILNSYHKGLSWSDNIINGIENKFKTDFPEDYNLYIEYLDEKRFGNNSLNRVYYNYLKNKYANYQFELIITNDDYAFNFLTKYKKELFENVPVVFSGLNIPFDKPVNYTGLKESIDLKSNFDLIQKFHPNLKRLYVISDDSPVSRMQKRTIENIMDQNSYSYDYQFLTNYTYKELFQKVKNLESGNALFMGVFTEDKSGKYYSFKDFINKLNKYISVPAYSAWDFYMENGIVGGKVIEGYKYGEETAEIAFEVLSGREVNSIPVRNVTSSYVFDYKQVKKYNISLRKLPDNSILVNSPYELFKENKTLFIALLVLIVLLILIIIILLRYNRLRTQKIKEQESYLKKIETINLDLEAAKKKAQEANDLKASFLANISHEIRTPLNAIIGFSRLITDHPNLSRETYNKYYNLLKVNSNLLLNLINDIIDLSKIESNQLKINYIDFDLNELMDNIYDYAVEERDKTDKLKIEVKLDKGIRKKKFSIRSDDSRLRQVFMNLIHNAIKFTFTGEVVIGYRVSGDNILFFVKDTGIGLSNYEYKYIFDSFRQGEEGTTRKFGGAGLGLTLSKGIIENLDGRIWAESNDDNGSVFYFQIPFIPAKVSNEKKSKDFASQLEEEYNWNDKNILVVEDSFMAYELITKLLKGTGAKFLLEVDGFKAIDRCKNDDSIDLVLMDIQLPFLDGYEATREIKKVRPDLPIIAQTANAMLDDRKRALEAGCEDYIAKPLDRLELADKINKLLYKFKSKS